jgi:hypothetical protein
VNEILLAGSDNPDYTVDITAHWEKKVDAILCHTSQIGGRTKEEFLRDRRERDEREGTAPMEEKFRRWSIRRPPRQQPQDDDTKEESDTVQANGLRGETPGALLVGAQKGQRESKA